MPDSGKGGTCGRIFWRALVSGLENLAVIPAFLMLQLPKKNKPSYGERRFELLGRGSFIPDGQKTVWIHTVSVGETLGAASFIKLLAARCPDLHIVVTTTTTTGAAAAAKSFKGIAEHRFAPLDAGFAVESFIRRVHPSALLIMETELWPTVLASAKRHGIPVIVINARLSERSRGRFARFRGAFDTLIAPNITLMAAQTEDDESRLRSLGIQNTCVTGSIKYDITPDKELAAKGLEVRKAAGGRPIITAASTHGDESLMVLRAFHEIKKKVPDALLILVPRHPEEFERAFNESVSEGFRTKRRSSDGMPSSDTEVFIGDSMGEMTVWFAASRAAFMAGSLIPVGGHNPLEPAVFGVPVITGPNYFNFEDIFRRLFAAGGAFAVADVNELAEKAAGLLGDPELAYDAGRRAEECASEGTGACQRTLDAVLHACPGLAG